MILDVNGYKLSPGPKIGTARFSVLVTLEQAEGIEKIINNKSGATLELKRKVKKRSLTANAYCWVVCEAIAKKINSTKEDVYRRAISRVGKGEVLSISLPALARFETAWSAHGIGWIVDKISDDGINATVVAYYGSSTYTTKEMARLIDWLVDEAEELNIDVLPPRERSLLVDDWKPEV